MRAGRMLYLASGPVPSESANAVNVSCMSAAFRERGYDVSIAAPAARWPDLFARGEANGSAVDRLWLPEVRGGGLAYRSGLRARLRLRRPDVVYGRMLQGCRVAAGAGVPTAFEAHMPVWRQDAAKHRAFAEMSARTSLAGVVVISEALGRALVEDFPALEKRVVVAHDAASYRPRPVLRRPEPTGPLKVLYAGSLYPGKGMELLIELAPRCPWARFSILGGTDVDLRLWQERARNVDNIELLGRKPHEEVSTRLDNADVLVAPYQDAVRAQGGRRNIAQWMSPLKIFEYMAANRPMVVSDLPVLREVLTDRRNALLVAPGDVEGWAAALERLCRDAELGERLAATARDDFEQCHTWDARAGHVLRSLGWDADRQSVPATGAA